MLLAADSDPTLISKDGESPSDIAAANTFTNIVELIKEAVRKKEKKQKEKEKRMKKKEKAKEMKKALVNEAEKVEDGLGDIETAVSHMSLGVDGVASPPPEEP